MIDDFAFRGEREASNPESAVIAASYGFAGAWSSGAHSRDPLARPE